MGNNDTKLNPDSRIKHQETSCSIYYSFCSNCFLRGSGTCARWGEISWYELLYGRHNKLYLVARILWSSELDGLAETSINSLNINIVWALRDVRGYLYCQDQDQKAFMYCVHFFSLFSYTSFLIWKSHQPKIQYFNFKMTNWASTLKFINIYIKTVSFPHIDWKRINLLAFVSKGFERLQFVALVLYWMLFYGYNNAYF